MTDSDRPANDAPHRRARPATGTPFVSGTSPAVRPAAPASMPVWPKSPFDTDTLDAYIESPELFEENREPTHASTTIPYGSVEAALDADERYTPLTERFAASQYYELLDGDWDFQYYDHPSEIPDSIAEETWDSIPVPSVWQLEGYDRTVYVNNAITWERFDPPLDGDLDPRDDGISLPETNPTAIYRRSVTVPEHWNDREVFLHFGGVKQAVFVWIDGQYVGFQQGSNTPGEFDVTEHVTPGEDHEITVRVHRFSDGEALETIDMFRYSGIFRSVALFATPKTHVRDWFVRTELDEDYEDGRIRVDAELTNYDTGEAPTHELRAELYEPAVDPLSSEPLTVLTAESGVEDGRSVVTLETELDSPSLWSAETPNLYTLVLEVIDPDGETIEALREKVGVREIETTRGQRGAQILVNGTPVTIRGTNRHEMDPDHGIAVPPETTVTDIERLKQFNLNAVRCSHYPNQPTFYRLADEYGLYVQDEVNAETHWWEELAAETTAFHEQFLARFRRMVLRDRNHPSIFSWSTGNEAGTGAEHIAMAALCLADDEHLPKEVNGERFEGDPLGVDPTRLLYHQPNGGGWTIDYGDMLGPRYPSIESLLEEGDGTGLGEGLRPVVMGEYNHAMGNSLGIVDDMWAKHIQPPVRRARDRSPAGRDGVLVGSPTVVPGVDADGAVALAGGDHIEVPDVPPLDHDAGFAIGLRVSELGGDGVLVDAGGARIERTGEQIRFSISGDDDTASVAIPLTNANEPIEIVGSVEPDAIRLSAGPESKSDSHSIESPEGSRHELRIGAALDDPTGPAVIVDALTVWNSAVDPSTSLDAGEVSETTVLSYDFADLLRDQALAGGFIWDWVNQDLNATAEIDGETIAYQDYDDDAFCLDGLVWSDREPTPALYQLKYNHQPVGIAPAAVADGELYLTNHHGFRSLAEFDVRWELRADDAPVQSGRIEADVAPGETRRVTLPIETPTDPTPGTEYWLDVTVAEPDATAYASAGHEVATESLAVPFDVPEPGTLDIESLPPVSVAEGDDEIRVTGENFTYIVDRDAGTLASVRYEGTELLEAGPVFDAWRTPIMNESQSWGGEQASSWYEAGLDSLEQSVDSVAVTAGDTTATIDVTATLEGAELGTRSRTTDPTSGVHAEVYGDPEVVDGVSGQALALTGESFLGIERTDAPDLDDGLTLSCWVKPNEPQDGGGPQPYVIAGGQYTLKRTHAKWGGELEFSVYSDGWRTVTAPVPEDWTDGWHHLAGVWDPDTGELRLAVDGEQLATTEFGGTLGEFDGRVRVGRDRAAFLADGTRIDDVRVYHSARSTADIESSDSPADAFVWLPFEEFETVDPDRPGFDVRYRYRVFGSGDVAISVRAEPNGQLRRTIDDYLPKVGLSLSMPGEFDHFEWYGRGPLETYPDRKTSQAVDRYAGSAMDQFVPYLPPTDNGNKTDTRWAMLSNGDVGLLGAFLGDPGNVTLDQWTNLDAADHHYELESDETISLSLDHAVSGVGGTPVPLNTAYQVDPKPVTFGVRLRPITDEDPLGVARSRLAFDVDSPI